MLDTLSGWIRRRIAAPRTASTGVAASVRDAAVDYKALAENSLDLIVRCGSDQIASYASPSVMQLLGIEPEELIGRSHLSFVHPEDLPMLREVIEEHHAGKPDQKASFRMRRKDGTTVWVEGMGRMVPDPASGEPNFVVVMRDITERKELEARLAALALTDGLTGLANRRAFDGALETEWRRCERERATLSLLLLDVDCFKRFNDHYGHQTGDDCLRAVAAAVKGAVHRGGDLVARYGGEEVAVILPNTEMEGAVAVAEAVREAVEKLRIPHQQSVVAAGYVTVSVGCATAIPRPGGSGQMPTGLLQAADAALYKAKEKGRNRVETALLLCAGGG